MSDEELTKRFNAYLKVRQNWLDSQFWLDSKDVEDFTFERYLELALVAYEDAVRFPEGDHLASDLRDWAEVVEAQAFVHWAKSAF